MTIKSVVKNKIIYPYKHDWGDNYHDQGLGLIKIAEKTNLLKDTTKIHVN